MLIISVASENSCGERAKRFRMHANESSNCLITRLATMGTASCGRDKLCIPPLWISGGSLINEKRVHFSANVGFHYCSEFESEVM